MSVLKFKKLHAEARLPVRASFGAAAFDLYANLVGFVEEGTLMVRTGVAVAVPDNHVLLIFSRSGQGFKDDTRLANCVGVIDSDYRGELMVKLTADRNINYLHEVKEGDRVAQAMLLQLPDVTVEEVDELDSTDRGENGFGSTGK